MKEGSSVADLKLQPGHTNEEVIVVVKLAANQSLVFGDLKDFSSSVALIITHSHLHKPFFSMIEVDLNDSCFSLVDDSYNLSNLFGWVEIVTTNEVIYSRLACPTIT